MCIKCNFVFCSSFLEQIPPLFSLRRNGFSPDVPVVPGLILWRVIDRTGCSRRKNHVRTAHESFGVLPRVFRIPASSYSPVTFLPCWLPVEMQNRPHVESDLNSLETPGTGYLSEYLSHLLFVTTDC